MTDEQLETLEMLAMSATAGRWVAYVVDDGAGGFVFSHTRDGPPSEVDLKTIGDDEGGFEVAPDNGVHVAGQREVNRGYLLGTGDSWLPEMVPLKLADALFIAACRDAVPELVAEVRRLKRRMLVEMTGMSEEMIEAAEELLRKLKGKPKKQGGE